MAAIGCASTLYPPQTQIPFFAESLCSSLHKAIKKSGHCVCDFYRYMRVSNPDISPSGLPPRLVLYRRAEGFMAPESRDHILASLSSSDLKLIAPHLKQIVLNQGDVLLE